MSQKIPREKLLDLYERSVNAIMRPEQCAIWLPVVCEYALELLKEKEGREKVAGMVQKVEEFKKTRNK